jgi:DNA-3-methyladenine glycosylase II
LKEAPVRVPERIETEADLRDGAAVLVERDARFGPILSAVGPLPLRRQADGFGALVSAIVGQQVSTASASAILGRLEAAGLTGEEAVAAASDEALRACGLSRPKMRYLRALACARLDYGALRVASTDVVMATLTSQPGIGRWTAEIYAKFALGHADVFAAGDLALQVAAARAFALPARPGEREMRAMAEAWSPVRSVAARALWAYYRLDTKREGVL